MRVKSPISLAILLHLFTKGRSSYKDILEHVRNQIPEVRDTQISYHLKRLKKLELIENEKNPNNRVRSFYRITDKGVAELSKYIDIKTLKHIVENRDEINSKIRKLEEEAEKLREKHPELF